MKKLFFLLAMAAMMMACGNKSTSFATSTESDIMQMEDPSIAAEFADYADVPTFLGVEIYNGESVLNLLIRFAFNLLVAWVLVHFAYYRKAKRKDWYVTFMLFSTTMFLLIFLMENVKLQIGFTLGLFAIFGMIRYRTETVPIREMTYLFVIIGMSVINGLAMTVSIVELALTNLLLVGLCFLLEALVGNTHETAKLILYDKIDLIVPEKRDELVADLTKRTGIQNIKHVEIGHVDFLRDVAFIKIYYNILPGEKCTINDQVKPRS